MKGGGGVGDGGNNHSNNTTTTTSSSSKAPSAVQKNYVVKGLVGKGSYGTVHKVKRIADGLICAMKETNVLHMTQEERMEAVKQILLLTTVRHQNVIKYYDAFVDGDKMYTVMEYCERGDLAKQIRNRAQHFEEAQIWSYFIQILRGVVALHSYNIIHRDIKSANVMCLDANSVKIGDLGVPKLLKQSLGTTQIGTPHYMAPELWKNEPYTFSSDMWALGCVLYELAALSIPFRGQTLFDLRTKLLQGEYPPIPAHFSSSLTTVLKHLLNADQAWRLSSKEVLIHPLVRSHYHLAPPSIRLYVPRRKTVADKPAVTSPQAHMPSSRIPKPPLPTTATGLKVRARSPVRVAIPGSDGPAVTVRRQPGAVKVRVSAPRIVRQAKPPGTGALRPRAILSSRGNDSKLDPAAATAATAPSGPAVAVTATEPSISQAESTKQRVLRKPLPSLSPLVNNKRLKRISLANTKLPSPKDPSLLNRRFKQAYIRSPEPEAPESTDNQEEEAVTSTSEDPPILVSPRIAPSDLPEDLTLPLTPKAHQPSDAPKSSVVPAKPRPSSVGGKARDPAPIATKIPTAPKLPTPPKLPSATTPRAPLSTSRIPSPRPSVTAPKAPLTTPSKPTRSPVSTPRAIPHTPKSTSLQTPLPKLPAVASKIPSAPGLIPIKARHTTQPGKVHVAK